jgi:hypothetical protein
MRMRISIGVLLCCIICVTVGQTRADDPPFVQAARKRQETIKSIELSFKQADYYPPGALTELFASEEKGSAKPQPSNEITIDSTNQLFIDGNKYRFENNNVAIGESGTIYHRAMFSLFDGKNVKTFLPNGITGDKTPVGTVEASPFATEINSGSLTPILRWMRPLDATFTSKPLSAAKPTGVSQTIDEDECEEFELRFGPDVTEHYWLAAAKDYLPRRIAFMNKDVILRQTDIHYARNDTSGWQPESWLTNEFNSRGDLQISQQIEVEALNLNTPQSDDRFEMLFPAKTDFFDATDGKTYRVQDDGTAKRTEPMYGEELSETKIQPGDSWFRAHKWTLSLGIGALCGCVLVIAYRGWKGRQAA